MKSKLRQNTSRRTFATVDLGRSWAEAPALSHTRILQLTLGAFYLAGAILVLLGAATFPSDANHVVMAGIGGVGLAVGLLIITVGHRLGRWAYHALLVVATALVTLVVASAGDAGGGMAISTLYLFVLVASIFLFSIREALVHVVISQVACAVGLTVAGYNPGTIAVTIGAALCVSGITGWLARVIHANDNDALTGTLSRRGYELLVSDELIRSRRTGAPISLILLDIDNFHEVNDETGSSNGDRMLVACTRSWASVIPSSATIARFGGDSFAIVMPGCSLGQAADLADELRAASPRTITLSAGVATASPGDSASMITHRAVSALYDAKESGRDRSVVYGDPDRSSSELENAVRNDELTLHLQPIVDLARDQVEAYEALVRWRHPVRGLVPPYLFVQDAERTGAIHSLGSWVLEEAVRLIVTSPGPRKRIAVNISVHELRTGVYAERVSALLKQWNLDGQYLIAEVTESVFDTDDDVVLETLTGLRELGILVAIDDFGAGYSSLGRLASLPIDIIKVDGTLIQAIDPASYDAPILEAIATMSRSLGVLLVAEHVETAHQAAVVRRLGYDMVQGHLFGRPLPS